MGFYTKHDEKILHVKVLLVVSCLPKRTLITGRASMSKEVHVGEGVRILNITSLFKLIFDLKYNFNVATHVKLDNNCLLKKTRP